MFLVADKTGLNLSLCAIKILCTAFVDNKLKRNSRNMNNDYLTGCILGLESVK